MPILVVADGSIAPSPFIADQQARSDAALARG